MWLNCAMQALRKEPLQVEVFLRQTASNFFNGGIGKGFDFEMNLPAKSLPEIKVDPFPASPGDKQPACQLHLAQCSGRFHPPGGQGRV